MSDAERDAVLTLIEVVKGISSRLTEVALEVIELKAKVAALEEKLIARPNQSA